MKKTELATLLDKLQIAYPFFYKDTDKTVNQIVNLWYEFLGDKEYRIVDKAIYNIIKTNDKPPTISMVVEEVDKLIASSIKHEYVWDETKQMCKEIEVKVEI